MRTAMVKGLLLLALPAVLLFIAVAALAPDAPWWDEYASTLGYLVDPMPERLRHLFDFHNEHRLVLPRLLADVFSCFPGRLSFFRMILFGDCILLGYVALWGVVYHRCFGLMCFVPFVWVFLDLANAENTLWALTSVQSHAVLLFALAAVLSFGKRTTAAGLLSSLVFALFSSLTSASGLGIWPALLIAALIGAGTPRERLRTALVIAVTGSLVIGFYMRGFAAASAAHTADYVWTLTKALDFLLCFLGNVAPIAGVARVFGVCSLAATVYILFHWRRLADEPVFIFFLYLHSITASGVLVRSCLPGCGLYSRLEIIAISIFCAEAFLLLRLWSGSPWFARARKVLLAGIPVAIAANLVALALGWNFLLDRKHLIEDGYRAWPADRTRLRAPDVTFADRMLQRYVDRVEGRVLQSDQHKTP